MNFLQVSEVIFLLGNASFIPVIISLNAFLGIGVDGHIASIFKEDMFNLNSAPFFLTKRKEEKFSRISISKDYLCSAKKIVFFLIGEKKQKLLRMIGKNEIDLPVNEIIKNAKGKVLVLTDLDIND